MEFPDVNDWKDVVAIGLILVGGWLINNVTIRRGQKKAHESHNELNTKVDDVLGQTRNGHDRPMREDIDRILNGQAQIIRNHEALQDVVGDTHRLVVGHSDDIRELKTDVADLKDIKSHRRKAV